MDFEHSLGNILSSMYFMSLCLWSTAVTLWWVWFRIC